MGALEILIIIILLTGQHILLTEQHVLLTEQHVLLTEQHALLTEQHTLLTEQHTLLLGHHTSDKATFNRAAHTYTVNFVRGSIRITANLSYCHRAAVHSCGVSHAKCLRF